MTNYSNLLVSIVVPVYNVSQWLPACLESCIVQSHKNIEVIAVNDGSTDTSRQVIESFIARDARIKVFNKVNGGLNSAREFGIKKAKGKFVTILDGDDFLQPDGIEKLLIAALESGADIVVAGANIIVDEDKTLLDQIQHKDLVTDCLGYIKRILKQGPNTVCMKLYMAHIVQAYTEYPNIKAGQDFPLTIQWALGARTVKFSSEIVYNYIVARPGSTMSGERKNFIEPAFQAFYFTFDLLLKQNAFCSFEKEFTNHACSKLYSYMYRRENKFIKNKEKVIVIRDFVHARKKTLSGKQFKLFIGLMKLNIWFGHYFVAAAQRVKPTLHHYSS